MWDFDYYGAMPRPLGMVVSDDIWKKFDLDTPKLSEECVTVQSSSDVVLEPTNDDISNICSEIRQHDCMWAGLCISKKHNKLLSARNDRGFASRTVMAGRSLLLSRATDLTRHQREHYCSMKNEHKKKADNLESDGDSRRSGTIQSSSESDSDSEYDAPTFEHQFSIKEKLMECLSAPVSEVTGQCVRSSLKIKVEVDGTDHNDYSNGVEGDTNTFNHSGVSNTLNDHSYYINHLNGIKKLDYMGVQTPSDSEEEIDVVSFEKPAVLSTLPSMVDHKILHTTVKTVLNDKPAPRPRGRPPNSSRKRPAQNQVQEQKPAKRVAVQRTCQKKIINVPKNISPATLMPVKIEKHSAPSASTSEEEPDNDKRNIHNNMERQRRVELRDAFETLRNLVPELAGKDKAPKVAILRQGGRHCMKMKEIEDELIMQKEDLKRRQNVLRMQVSFLRTCLASKR